MDVIKSTLALSVLVRITCARATREAILDAYPVAEEDAVLRRALMYLLFGGRCWGSKRRLKLDMAAAEWIAGYKIYHAVYVREYPPPEHRFRRAEEVLEHVRDRLLPRLKWTEHRTGRPRTLLASGIRRDIQRLVRQDLATPVGQLQSRVLVLGGQLFRPNHRTQSRRDLLDECGKVRAKPPSETTAYFLDRMNHVVDRPFDGFTKLGKFTPEAIKVARGYWIDGKMPQRKGKKGGTSQAPPPTDEDLAKQRARTRARYRRSLLALIRSVSDMPQPFYRPSRNGNTDRIFGIAPSILDMPSEVRRALTEPAGWVDLDLAAAQLGIAARLWDMPDLVALLQGTTSVWEVLGTELGAFQTASPERFSRIKDVFKKAVYSTVFGMKEPRIKGRVTWGMSLIEEPITGADFVNAPTIRMLLAARDRVYRQMAKGRVFEPPTDIALKPDRTARQQMATVAQSYEAVLMCPVLEYEVAEIARARAAGEQPDFRIMLWQHDGCSVRFNARRATHVEGMKKAVEAVAAQHGIPTKLEVKG